MGGWVPVGSEMDNSLRDRILESVDIVDLIGERLTLSRSGSEYIGLCPFHPDHKPSLRVSPKKQIFKCFACGAGGDVFKFVQLSTRVDFREALEILARRAGIDYRARGESGSGPEQRESLRQVVDWATSYFQNNLLSAAGRPAREYATRRGMTPETIQRFGLGFAPDSWEGLRQAARRARLSEQLVLAAGLLKMRDDGRVQDRMRNRLIFPIHDATGRVIAFGGRALGDEEPKYLNSPETPLFHKSRTVYGFHLARPAIERAREVVVVEGYVDAVLLHQGGIANTVAPLGTALTDTQVRALSASADRIIMCFDGDDAGVRAADRAVEVALRFGVDVRVALMVNGEDPADCMLRAGPDGLKSLLHSAIDALEFKWQRTRQALASSGPRGQREALEALLVFIGSITATGGLDPIQQGVIVARISELVGVPPGSVYERLQRARSEPRQRAAAGSDEGEPENNYRASVRAAPAGMTAAVEELFGLALRLPERRVEVLAQLETVRTRVATWGALLAEIERVAAGGVEPTLGNVMERCDQPDVIELLGLAAQRVPAGAGSAEQCTAAGARLAAELERLRMQALCERLAKTGGGAADQEQAFRSLLAVGRRQHAFLPAEQADADAAVGSRGRMQPMSPARRLPAGESIEGDDPVVGE